MENELELLYPPTVFRETLWGARYFERMAELEAAGARIETQERGRGNAEWIVTWRKPIDKKGSHGKDGGND